MTPAAPVPEAVLLSEYWGEVLCFAQLCALTPEAGGRLAADAFDRGLAVAKEPYTAHAPGTGGAGLPCLPFLLTAVRDTTAHWAAGGDGDSLQPELRIWLNAERAARRARTGAQRTEPLALRGLRAMPERVAETLWYAEVECRPAGDPRETDRAHEIFREHCLSAHLAEPPTHECAAYAGLLDVTTRMPQEAVPEDLRRHLNRCPECTKAAVCLTPHGDGLAQALAEGVLGWAGPSYLEARRQAARTGEAQPPFPRADRRPPRRIRRPAGRVARRVPGGRVGVVAAAGLLAAVVGLTVLVTADDSAPRAASAAPTAQGGTDAGLSPLPGPAAPSAPAPTGTQDPSDDASFPGDAEPSAAEHTIPAAPDRRPSHGAPPARPSHSESSAPAATCSVTYTLVDQWDSGFQAAVTVTTRTPRSDWRLEWTFPDGQRVTQMWDADFTQSGPSVTVRAKGYNGSLGAGGSAAFGFIGARYSGNAAPASFSLDGSRCAA
ncbi:cellulose binding domain-containing protein [Streptomyces sp. NPDC058691]|uniref:cellulose binding domain-containing protein n=1 Tax=Streptomyces sp. NPDC058691 TaxID=3346601 RepID=UPI0036595A5F